MSTLPLHGLLLAGGKSSRMGRDKALIRYHGEANQLEHGIALLQDVCDRTFVSVRGDQEFPLPEQAAPIIDSHPEIGGPLCGILSAMTAFPNAHWLVIACDLPNLTSATLQTLASEFRKHPPHLTAYRSSSDSLPEPLCAIYPAGSDRELLRLVEETGKFCPRKLLIVGDAHLIDQENPNSLDNINTPEEFASLRSS